MSDITPSLVKELREKTNAGMMDCKRALVEAAGDLAKAEEILRKKGIASAGKKSSRVAKEGIVASYIHLQGKVGVLVEINCETDFVAKNDAFRAMADSVAHKFAENDAADVEADRVEAVQKLGENIQVRRHARLEVQGNGGVATYIHTGGKVGVIVEVGAEKDSTTQTEEFKQLVRDITLQIAAASPVCVSRASVPQALAEREREVYRGQVPPGKPANIVEQIVEGKMSKFYSNACLVDQAFIKNPDLTIAQLVAEKSKALGEQLEVRRFVRFAVGEELAQ